MCNLSIGNHQIFFKMKSQYQRITTTIFEPLYKLHCQLTRTSVDTGIINPTNLFLPNEAD
jgi:hypothetical protein